MHNKMFCRYILFIIQTESIQFKFSGVIDEVLHSGSNCGMRYENTMFGTNPLDLFF